MSCPDEKHDLRAINPFVHPTEVDGNGDPLEVIGAPPQSEEEPAWCRNCGALWCKRPFGMGWGWSHATIDEDAPTLGNLIREMHRPADERRLENGSRVEVLDKFVKMLRDTADRLEDDDRGGLTGVALIAEGVSGVFTDDGPLTGVWTSPQGGQDMIKGLQRLLDDADTLMAAYKERLQ